MVPTTGTRGAVKCVNVVKITACNNTINKSTSKREVKCKGIKTSNKIPSLRTTTLGILKKLQNVR